MSKIFEIYGSDAHQMTMALMEAADVASMIPKGGQCGSEAQSGGGRQA